MVHNLFQQRATYRFPKPLGSQIRATAPFTPYEYNVNIYEDVILSKTSKYEELYRKGLLLLLHYGNAEGFFQ